MIALPIYLDYNATTPIAPEVARAMQPFVDEQFGNPSSTHAYGHAAHEAIVEARAPAPVKGAKRRAPKAEAGAPSASEPITPPAKSPKAARPKRTRAKQG